MGVLSYLKEVYRISTTPPGGDSATQEGEENKYPLYGGEAQLSIVWRCDVCENQFLQKPGEPVACGHCGEEYSCYDNEDTPEALKSRCPRCDKESDEIRATRAENMWFDCPYCPFRWESSRY